MLLDNDPPVTSDQASSDTVPINPDAEKRKRKMAKTASKTKTAPKARKASKGKTSARRAVKKGSTAKARKGKARVMTGLNAKGHRPDSRKAKAHDLFDKLGADKARAMVLKLGVKPNTVTSWFSTFRNA